MDRKETPDRPGSALAPKGANVQVAGMPRGKEKPGLFSMKIGTNREKPSADIALGATKRTSGVGIERFTGER